jgi:peptidyl-prolyl cis-trans isomerase A (cyclophilin A)
MLVDVSHASDETFDAGLETSRTPIIASHSSCWALADAPRNLSDRMIRALAAQGGVVQINYERSFLCQAYRDALARARREIAAALARAEKACGENEACKIMARSRVVAEFTRRGKLPRVGREKILEHIEHAIGLVGPEHVGLGCDFDGATMPRGMEDCSRLPAITGALLARGYSTDDIRKILAGNLLRVLAQAERARKAQEAGNERKRCERRSESSASGAHREREERMRMAWLILAMIGLCAGLALAAGEPEQGKAPGEAKPAREPGLYMTFVTSMGSIPCKLYEKEAPVTVHKIVGLALGKVSYIDPRTGRHVAGKKFYDGLIFHRVIPNFMIQGGDPLGTGMGGPKGAGFPFKDEIVPTLRFDVPGRLAMANAGPNTNGSQFFITEVPTPWLDGHHTIFGQCGNLDVVRAIVNVPRDANDRPLKPVVIEHVVVERVGPAPADAPESLGPHHATPHRPASH